MSASTAFFSIASKNYLAHARVLFHSIQAFHPDAECFLILCDEPDSCFDPSKETFNILRADQLGIDPFSSMAFKYTQLEFCTAVKPHAAEYLFKNTPIQKLIYLDPDICLYQKLDDLLATLENHAICLVPHLTDFLKDDGLPNEQRILQSGVYNLGFLGLKRSSAVDRLLPWWQRKLFDDCRHDMANGLFVDQRWMDLIPGIFSETAILRNPEYDVAYWDLPNRTLTENSDGTVLVNGNPLRFFHFSGYHPDHPDQISKHTDRYPKGSLKDPLKRILSDYKHQLQAKGYQEVSTWPYAYACFSNNVPIPDFCRTYFREVLQKDSTPNYNPFEPSAAPTNGKSIYTQLCDPINNQCLTGCAWALYRFEPQLQEAFPNIPGTDEADYLRYFTSAGAKLFAIPEPFVTAACELLDAHGEAQGASSGAIRKALGSVIASSARMLSQTPIKRAFSTEFKDQVKSRLFWMSHLGTRGSAAKGMPASTPLQGSAGLNVFGPLELSTGLGEGARSSVRAMKAVHLNVSQHPFTQADLDQPQHKAGSSTKLDHSVNLFHLIPGQAGACANTYGATTFANRLNIGYWVWELETFPSSWDLSFQYFDEIWTPSSFVQKSLALRAPIPVLCMPHCVTLPTLMPKSKKDFGLPENSSIVLCLFDAGSYPERKNPWAAIRAFRKALQASSHEPKPHLVVKVNQSEKDPEVLKRLTEELKDLPSTVISKPMKRVEVFELMAACDILISLHRSEGFGLVLAEAMALGKPVIATGYSGNMEFMHAGNSFPVRYDLKPLEKTVGPYPAGYLWAEPDEQHAAECLGKVWEDPELSARIGTSAQETIQSHFSPEAIGKLIQTRLAALGVI